MAAPDAGYDPAWNQVGRFAGYFAGVALLVTVVLSLADGLGILGSVPPYRRTQAGPMQDEATYWVGYFAHQRQIDWDIFLRDSSQALAGLAIVAIGLAVLNLVGIRRAIAQLAMAAIGVGAILSIFDALAWLTLAQYWRSDWSQAAPEILVAVGRDTEAIQSLTHLYTDMSSLSFAIGLFFLARLASPGGSLPPRLRYLAYAGALLSILSLVSTEAQLDTPSLVLTLLSALVFPSLLIWLGRHFARLGLREPQLSGASSTS
jgi:hypothetical protein